MIELVRREASTRSAGLIRIGLVLLLWARFAAELMLPVTPSVWLSLVFFGATSCLLIGLCTRVAAGVTAIVMLVIYLWFGVHAGRAGWIHHHHYLLVSACCVCALTPCGRSFSLDRWRSGAAEIGPVWALRLYSVQIAAVYLWSAVDKIDAEFLNGGRLDRIATAVYWWWQPGQWSAALTIAAWVVTLLELMLGVGFLLGRTPRWSLLAGLGLHATLYVCMPVATFSATMILLYVAAIDPAVVHRAIDRVTRA